MKFKKTLSIDFDVPNLGYDLKFQSVYQTNDELIAIAVLTKPKGMFALAAVGCVNDSIELEYGSNNLVLLPTKYYVLGVPKNAWYVNGFSPIDTKDEIAELKNSDCVQIYSNENMEDENEQKTKFLNLRQSTLEKTRVSDDHNRNQFIINSLSKYPEQIQNTNDLTFVMAQLLKVKPEQISRSEMFETKMIHFIRQLDAEQLPFLTKNTDVSGYANYSLANEKIGFRFYQFTVNQLAKMADVLAQYFPNILHPNVVQLKKDEPYYITLDKTVFLRDVLPCLMGMKHNPEKQITFDHPQIIDFQTLITDANSIHRLSKCGIS